MLLFDCIVGVTYMRDTLNLFLSNRYVYVNLTEQSFINGLIYSIDRDYPVICHVMTEALANYTNEDCGHYVVARGYISGYFGNEGVSNVHYNDPHYNDSHFGIHTDTIANMSTAIENNAGFFIRSR